MFKLEITIDFRCVCSCFRFSRCQKSDSKTHLKIVNRIKCGLGNKIMTIITINTNSYDFLLCGVYERVIFITAISTRNQTIEGTRSNKNLKKFVPVFRARLFFTRGFSARRLRQLVLLMKVCF